MTLTKFIHISISVIFIFFSLCVSAQEADEQYLLSSDSYKVLSEVHKLMDNQEYATAEIKLKKLLDSDLDEYDQAVAWQTLGYIYISVEKYDSASAAFINALKNNALPPELGHELSYTIAQLLARSEKYRDSLEYLNRWFEKETSPDAEAHMFIASVYYQLKDYHNVIPHVRKAIDKSNKPEKQWYEMLLAGYFQTKQLQNAADLLETMIILYPDYPDYWLQLAKVYYQIKNYKKSLAVYKLAYTKGILDQEEIIRLARLYLNEQLPYQAGELLEEAIKAGKISKSGDNLKLLSDSWLLAREYDLAISTLQDLAGIDDDPDIYFRIGQIYFDQGKWQDAVNFLDRSTRNADQLDNKAEAYLLLGIAAYHTEENSRSAEALKKAVGYKNTRQQAEWWLNKLENRLEQRNS